MGALVLEVVLACGTPANIPQRSTRCHPSLSLTPLSTPLALSYPNPTLPFSSPLMAGESGPPERARTPSAYEEVLNCLSSLITKRTRGDGSNRGNQFDLMELYLQMLDLEEAVENLKVIHVAGTKGKGSTCSFTESILRSCGFRTGLFTSPHLIDIRERFKLDGVEISEEKFMEYFWWCWDRLKEKTAKTNVSMPTFFRFLALLAFKIFSAEQVDVTILEVGLGGRFDATNVVKAPVVCGVASLGYDHMEILGNTLGQIASEKAGIFKEHVPAYTVPQPEEAMRSLEKRASQLGISLSVAAPLDIGKLNGKKLGLDGEHQYLNAGLAVALCCAWLNETGQSKGIFLDENFSLPEQFISGLAMTGLSGRAQVVPDLQFYMQSQGHLSVGGLIFYLDGAHSPESIEICARWFSNAIKEDMNEDHGEQMKSHNHNVKQILLFNCMEVRDPQLLLPRLVNSCADHGVHFHKALFVPNQSLYYKVGSHAAPVADSEVDLTWQQKLQKVWESVVRGERGSRINSSASEDRKDVDYSSTKCQESSAVIPSLPLAIKWLRDISKENRSCRFQVLVTGSLHLVGDVLRLIKR